jgi:hypothetical protein
MQIELESSLDRWTQAALLVRRVAGRRFAINQVAADGGQRHDPRLALCAGRR